MKLKTIDIIRNLMETTVPGDYGWELALESAASNGDTGVEDAIDAARFLEKHWPEREWTAAQYHGLMQHHFTGRWKSAAEIGHIRAGELFEDEKEKYAASEKLINDSEQRWVDRTKSDAAAGMFIRNWTAMGTYVFDGADGTVLTFDGIVSGVILEEDPLA